MDLSIVIENGKGDKLKVALSCYNSDLVKLVAPIENTIDFEVYDVSLLRESGSGFVGYRTLNAVSDFLSKFMAENNNAILTFYCNPRNDVLRNHTEIPPQEYRSRLFTRMFDNYIRKHPSELINHVVVIDTDDITQFVHFICRENQIKDVHTIESGLMQDK